MTIIGGDGRAYDSGSGGDGILVDDGRDAHVHRILRALDVSVAVAARSRGFDACVGLNSLHTKSAELAYALGDLICDPVQHRARTREALEGFMAELVRSFDISDPDA